MLHDHTQTTITMSDSDNNAVVGILYSILLLLIGAFFRDYVCYYLCCCCCCFSCRKKKQKDDDPVVVVQTSKNTYSLKDAYVLLFCLPLTGAHHFYLNRLVHGSIYICTLGFFGLGFWTDVALLSWWRAAAESKPRRRGVLRCMCLSITGICFMWIAFIVFLVGVYVKGPVLLQAGGFLEESPVSPYDVLEISRHSTEKEIRTAYKDMAKKWHPDRNPNCPECNEKMEDINEAFEKLKETDFAYSDVDSAKEQWDSIIENLAPKFTQAFTSFEFHFSSSSNTKKEKRKNKRRKDEF